MRVAVSAEPQRTRLHLPQRTLAGQRHVRGAAHSHTVSHLWVKHTTVFQRCATNTNLLLRVLSCTCCFSDFRLFCWQRQTKQAKVLCIKCCSVIGPLVETPHSFCSLSYWSIGGILEGYIGKLSQLKWLHSRLYYECISESAINSKEKVLQRTASSGETENWHKASLCLSWFSFHLHSSLPRPAGLSA